MSDSHPPSSAEVIFFQIENGSVSGDATQEETEAFAADLQGLRHFASRLGFALDLGDAWHAGFREEDFTHLWACTSEGTSETDPAAGAMAGRHLPYYELIEHLTQNNG